VSACHRAASEPFAGVKHGAAHAALATTGLDGGVTYTSSCSLIAFGILVQHTVVKVVQILCVRSIMQSN
jgi:hypothetical protein